MVTIKGPIKIKVGEEFPDKIKDAINKASKIETKIKIETSEKKEQKEQKEQKTEQKEKKTEGYTKDDLEKLSFTKLRKIGYKFKVKDRDRDKLIEEILKAQ